MFYNLGLSVCSISMWLVLIYKIGQSGCFYVARSPWEEVFLGWLAVAVAVTS